MQNTNVIELSAFSHRRIARRKPVVEKRTKHTEIPESPAYVCLTCDTDKFKILSSGQIYCAHCGALIKNLKLA